ncbi:MAG: hypothetical protein WKG00_17560 [Polyangiaceae bacterium]
MSPRVAAFASHASRVSWASLASLLALGLLAACDNRPPLEDRVPGAKVPDGGAEAGASATAPATAAPTATATAAKRPMPPRPVPIGSSGPIQPSAPPEQQMMAIQYTLAMLSPQATDPLVDKPWVEDIVKKLEASVRGADKGNTPANPVKADKGNRKLHVEMGKGCTDKTPANLLTRANSTLKAAYDAGVLVVMCHDDKWECHQSTRDPDDVLCVAAPR